MQSLTSITKNVVLSALYIGGSAVLIIINLFMFMGLAFDSGGGPQGSGPLGPYEIMIGRLSDYLVYFSLLVFLLSAISFFLYPYFLFKKTGHYARNIWLIVWFLLCAIYNVALVLPSIARYFI